MALAPVYRQRRAVEAFRRDHRGRKDPRWQAVVILPINLQKCRDEIRSNGSGGLISRSIS
jgi:hypothetical protein